MGDLEDASQRIADGISDLKAVIVDAQGATVSAGTLASVVELAALRTSSLLEDFLEELFYVSMLSEHVAPNVGPNLPVATRSEVDLLIYSDGRRRENYLTWLPFDVSLDRATAYLVAGQPFSWLRYRQVEVDALKELTIVRNAVAHPSSYAQGLLAELATKKGYQVLRPADYLQSLRGGSSEVLTLLTQVGVIAEALVAASENDADALLQPESLFNVGQKAPAGEFACTQCGHAHFVAVAEKLVTCPACGVVTRCPTCNKVQASSTTWRRAIT